MQMKSEHINTFGGCECTQDEECQSYLATSTANLDNQEMLAYSQFDLHDQRLFPSLHSSTSDFSLHYEPEYSTFFTSQPGVPSRPPEFRPNLHYEFNTSFPSMSYPSRNRPSLQFAPHAGTIEPLMMFNQGGSPETTQQRMYSPTFDIPPTHTQPIPPTFNALSTALDGGYPQHFSSPFWQHRMATLRTPGSELSTASPSEYEEEEEYNEGIYDKPYAQLIYEALIQAPGHRMLLRDIYDWFIKNTRKSAGGTNGWQNSIRHNLSMNRAFENDKNDPAASRGARKANSVWVLTDHAIKNGVQSTTRYRKNATSKKTSINRALDIQRQRSGAKGGRAARRAARLKRQEENQRPTKNTQTGTATSVLSTFSISPVSNAQDQCSSYSYSPTTPSDDQFLSSSYSLPQRSYYEYGMGIEPKYEEQGYIDEDERLRQILSQSTAEELFDDVARL